MHIFGVWEENNPEVERMYKLISGTGYSATTGLPYCSTVPIPTFYIAEKNQKIYGIKFGV